MLEPGMVVDRAILKRIERKTRTFGKVTDSFP